MWYNSLSQTDSMEAIISKQICEDPELVYIYSEHKQDPQNTDENTNDLIEDDSVDTPAEPPKDEDPDDNKEPDVPVNEVVTTTSQIDAGLNDESRSKTILLMLSILLLLNIMAVVIVVVCWYYKCKESK